jgi:flagellar basal-body rod protein FlgG
MQTGYYSVTGGLVTQFNRLNVISNNLANINTNGYKSDDIIIGDFERLFKESRDILPKEDNTKEGAKFINRSLNKVPQVVREYTDFSLGDLKKTGNTLDFALKNKNAFFLVLTPSGIRATRDGAFSINEDGHIVNKDGYPVLPKTYFIDGHLLEVKPNLDLKADKNGDLYQGGEQTNSLYIASFDNLDKLKKVGNNLYDFGEQQPVENSYNSVIQGFLERSNINAVREMANLIETNRLADMYQKVMDTQMNELNKEAIDKLGNVRG